jgi:hypothetical protein
LFCLVIEQAGVVRVNTDRGIDIRVTLGQIHGAVQGSAMWIAGANVENGGYAGIAGSLNDRFAIVVKLRTIYVCVRINKHFLNLEEIFGDRPSDLLGPRASRPQ